MTDERRMTPEEMMEEAMTGLVETISIDKNMFTTNRGELLHAAGAAAIRRALADQREIEAAWCDAQAQAAEGFAGPHDPRVKLYRDIAEALRDGEPAEWVARTGFERTLR